MAKTYKLQVWMTDQEKDAILEEAKLKGTNASEVVRSRVFITERQERAFNIIKKRLLDQALTGDTEALGLALDLAGTTQERLRAELHARKPEEIKKMRALYQAAHPEEGDMIKAFDKEFPQAEA